MSVRRVRTPRYFCTHDEFLLLLGVVVNGELVLILLRGGPLPAMFKHSSYLLLAADGHQKHTRKY